MKDPKEGYLLRATAFSKMRCSGGACKLCSTRREKTPCPSPKSHPRRKWRDSQLRACNAKRECNQRKLHRRRDPRWRRPMNGSGTYLRMEFGRAVFGTTLGSGRSIITMVQPAESLMRETQPEATGSKCSRPVFPSRVPGAYGPRDSSRRIRRAVASDGVHSPQ